MFNSINFTSPDVVYSSRLYRSTSVTRFVCFSDLACNINIIREGVGIYKDGESPKCILKGPILLRIDFRQHKNHHLKSNIPTLVLVVVGIFEWLGICCYDISNGMITTNTPGLVNSYKSGLWITCANLIHMCGFVD